MNELALTGISLLLLVLAGLGSVGVLVSRRAALVTEPEPEPQPQRAKRTRRRLTQPERESERAIILAALLAGVEPAMIARLLRGHAGYNRRKVNTVRRLNEHRFRPIQPRRTPALEVAA